MKKEKNLKPDSFVKKFNEELITNSSILQFVKVYEFDSPVFSSSNGKNYQMSKFQVSCSVPENIEDMVNKGFDIEKIIDSKLMEEMHHTILYNMLKEISGFSEISYRKTYTIFDRIKEKISNFILKYLFEPKNKYIHELLKWQKKVKIRNEEELIKKINIEIEKKFYPFIDCNKFNVIVNPKLGAILSDSPLLKERPDLQFYNSVLVFKIGSIHNFNIYINSNLSWNDNSVIICPSIESSPLNLALMKDSAKIKDLDQKKILSTRMCFYTTTENTESLYSKFVCEINFNL